MLFNVESHNHGALFSMIAKQQRGRVVSEAYGAARRQTAQRRDVRSVAAPEMKPQGSAAS